MRRKPLRRIFLFFVRVSVPTNICFGIFVRLRYANRTYEYLPRYFSYDYASLIVPTVTTRFTVAICIFVIKFSCDHALIASIII